MDLIPIPGAEIYYDDHFLQPEEATELFNGANSYVDLVQKFGRDRRLHLRGRHVAIFSRKRRGSLPPPKRSPFKTDPALHRIGADVHPDSALARLRILRRPHPRHWEALAQHVALTIALYE
jgi:hypothetical protein